MRGSERVAWFLANAWEKGGGGGEKVEKAKGRGEEGEGRELRTRKPGGRVWSPGPSRARVDCRDSLSRVCCFVL